MKRGDLLDGVLFLPAMAMLAAVIFVGFRWLIAAGDWLVRLYYGVLHDTFSLPHALAAALTVFLVPATFLAIGHLLWGRRGPHRPTPN